MRRILHIIILFVIYLFAPSSLLAQNESNKKGAFDEKILSEEEKLELEMNQIAPNKKRPANSADKSTYISPEVEPGAKRMSFSKKKTYTIRVLVTPDPLDMTNPVFRILPDEKVEFKQVKSVGYIYMIGNYKTHKEAMDKLKVVTRTFPDAKLITDKENPHID